MKCFEAAENRAEVWGQVFLPKRFIIQERKYHHEKDL